MKLWTDEELQKDFRRAVVHGHICDMPLCDDGAICGGTEVFLNMGESGTPPGGNMIYAKFRCMKCGQGSGWPTGYRHAPVNRRYMVWTGNEFREMEEHETSNYFHR